MNIYKALSLNIPTIAYSVIHQPRNTITAKEYIKTLHGLRSILIDETTMIKSVWQNHLSDMTAMTVQTSWGNLSQFLSTPLQSDTGEIKNIIRDQMNQTMEQLLPQIHYGLLSGYDGRFLTDGLHSEIPKAKIAEWKFYLQSLGFKATRSNSTIFESVYFVQGGSNLDILEHIMKSSIDIYNSSHNNEINKSGLIFSSVYNLLFLDGALEYEADRFELQIKFDKGKENYEVFHNDINESFKTFSLEIPDLNVSVWQRKLCLGIGEEYILRVRTKDRSTLRSLINTVQKLVREHTLFSKVISDGIWMVKEII